MKTYSRSSTTHEFDVRRISLRTMLSDHSVWRMDLILPRRRSFETRDELLPTVANADDAEELMYSASESGNLEHAAEIFQDFFTQRNGSAFDTIDYANFPRPSTNYSLLAAAAICNFLGALCIMINAFVIVAVLRNRKRVLTNVFYVLVLHCAFVDLIRGSCLVVWGLPHLLINNLRTIQERLLIFKINQFILIFLRSCNLMTIFMLLIFTLNEYVVIRYPLHYRRYLRRRTVLIILACSWMISLFFGIGSIFSNFFESAHSIMVLNNGSLHFRGNSTADISQRVTRRPIAGISISIICMLTIFFLCYLCLALVLVCYGTILRTIRQFHLGESKGKFCNEESQKFHRNTMRVIEIDKEGKSAIVTATNSNAADANGNNWTSEGQQNAQQPRCNSHRKWKSHLMSRHKYLIVIGSVLFVDILFLLPYSGIQLVALLHLNNVLTTSPRSALVRWGLQILIGFHSVCGALCYFRMHEFRRQSRDGAATNEEEPCSRQARRTSGSTVNGTDPMSKKQPHAVRRLSRLLSRGLLDSDDSSDTQEQIQPVLPAVTILDDPEIPYTPTEDELQHILDCGLGSPFLESNWSRVVGAGLRFRAYGDQREVLILLNVVISNVFCKFSIMPSKITHFVDIDEVEKEAVARLPRSVLGYYVSGADDEETLARNRKMFKSYLIRPLVLRNVRELDASVQLQLKDKNGNICFEKRFPYPIGIAPTALQKMAHHEGEIATARAAAFTNTLMINSTLSTTSLENVAEAAKGGTFWFQLYIYKDRKLTESLVRRAEAAGFSALVLTVDAPIFGRRRADERNGFELPAHLETLNWNDLKWLVEFSTLPVIVKGIMRADDAIESIKHGAAGLIVSNHGGRQIDSAPSTIEVLPEIAKAVNGQVPLIMDGGVRSGNDVFKALAFGAQMVLIGRPIVFGLAVGGFEGVKHVLRLIRNEFDYSLRLSGIFLFSGC
ncbi:Beta-2 adrenergic receptor [Aphelenchoides besseyi]|nr:Beta-2 adrenergic receptor [Aphelenchoides besseyi]